MKSGSYESGLPGVHCTSGNHQAPTLADPGPTSPPGTAPVPQATGTTDPAFAAAWRVLALQPDAIREIRRELDVALERWPDDPQRRDQHARHEAARLANLHARALDHAQLDLIAAIRATQRTLDARLADLGRSPLAAQYRQQVRRADLASQRSLLQDVAIRGYVAAARAHISGLSEAEHTAVRASYFREAMPFEWHRLEALTDALAAVTEAIAAFWSTVHAIVPAASRGPEAA